MSDEEQIAALREEIRRAGERLTAVRSFLWRLAMFVPVTMATLELYDRIRCGTVAFGARAGWMFLLGEAIFLTLAASAAGCVAVSLVASCRAMRRARLWERLASLAPAERAAVLLPLRDEGLDDTQKLVAPLLRGLRARALEVVPAPPGEGRGDEPSPAGEPAQHAAGVHGARAQRASWSGRRRAPLLRYMPRAVKGLLLCVLPTALVLVPLVPLGDGIHCWLPGTRWVVCVYNARSPSLPNGWEAVPPPGYAKVDRMLCTDHTIQVYSLRIGDSVYQIGRVCNTDCGAL